MGSLIVSWSPFTGQGSSSTVTASLAAMIALDTTKKVLFTHIKPSKSIMDELFNTSDSNSITETGMDGLEKLIKSKLLKPEALLDYVDEVYTGKLSYLRSGTLNDKSHREYTSKMFSAISAALKVYDVVIVNVNSGIDDLGSMKLIEQADTVLVNLPQSKFAIDKFVNGNLMPEELKNRNFHIIVTNYDRNAAYTVRNIKRHIKVKNKVFEFPYDTGLKNAINLGNVSDFYFRSFSVKKGKDTDTLIESIREINKAVLLELGLIVDGEMNE